MTIEKMRQKQKGKCKKREKKKKKFKIIQVMHDKGMNEKKRYNHKKSDESDFLVRKSAV